MKGETEKNRFIELRLKGLSYEKIAEELKVSKQTLISWNAKYQKDIDQLRLIQYDSLLTQYNEIGKVRFEELLKLKNRILEELQNRDLSEVKSIDLVTMFERIDNRIMTIKESVKCETEESEIDYFKIDCRLMKLD